MTEAFAEQSVGQLLERAWQDYGVQLEEYHILPRHLRRILAEICAVSEMQIFMYPETVVFEHQVQQFFTNISEVSRGKPLSRILGHREFWSLPFGLNTATLDPRADSETLIEAALACHPETGGALNVLDLGTGSGCLLLALLSEWPNARGIGVDLQSGAIEQACQNAKDLGLAQRAGFIQADFYQQTEFLEKIEQYLLAKPKKFEYIISNPPYIKTGDIQSLDTNVRNYDPMVALDGGIDGYDAYRALAHIIPSLLADGGWCLLEVGIGQASYVADIFKIKGFKQFQIKSDLSGVARIVMMQKALL